MIGIVFDTANSPVYGPPPPPPTTTTTSQQQQSKPVPPQRRPSFSTYPRQPNTSRTRKTSSYRHSLHLPGSAIPNIKRSQSDTYNQSNQTSSPKPINKDESTTSEQTHKTNHPAYQLVDEINRETDLYLVLGFKHYSNYNRYQIKFEDIRKAYITRSRICHPDKLPNYDGCTAAFQKLSLAYETLSKSGSRKTYDQSGKNSIFTFESYRYSTERTKNEKDEDRNQNNGYELNGDETLNGVLYSTFCEFLDGDFEMIRVLINALNEGNPGLNLGEESIESIESSLKKIRRKIIRGKKYMNVIKFEIMKIYELQMKLRSLSYFNLLGRFSISCNLIRVTLAIPIRLNQLIKSEGEEEEEKDDNDNEEELVVEEVEERRRREVEVGEGGILSNRIVGVLESTINVLEKSERLSNWVCSSFQSESIQNPSSSSSSASPSQII